MSNLSPGVSRVVVDAYLAGDDPTSDPLTPKERQVFQLISTELAIKAEYLGQTVQVEIAQK